MSDREDKAIAAALSAAENAGETANAAQDRLDTQEALLREYFKLERESLLMRVRWIEKRYHLGEYARR